MGEVAQEFLTVRQAFSRACDILAENQRAMGFDFDERGLPDNRKIAPPYRSVGESCIEYMAYRRPIVINTGQGTFVVGAGESYISPGRLYVCDVLAAGIDGMAGPESVRSAIGDARGFSRSLVVARADGAILIHPQNRLLEGISEDFFAEVPEFVAALPKYAHEKKGELELVPGMGVPEDIHPRPYPRAMGEVLYKPGFAGYLADIFNEVLSGDVILLTDEIRLQAEG